VTVSDGQGALCTAPVSAGQCLLTLGASGPRTLTATYTGDASFQASTSATGLPLVVATVVDVPALSDLGLALLAALLALAGLRLQRRRRRAA
jgi:exosortase sorting signal-containing protein